ncbi:MULTISPECIES: general stress protein [Pseudofrankia]|uniref:general stress protein n=1 Tax=Pseudofrankia TaxID=2994363 RepID=UPI000234D3BD|nr:MULTISPECIES: general stress protein [Pseudofrankia]OHV34765.1 hypothetical protein BCD49_22695 [Pseudofrankia sp. EUN1h]
MTTQPDGPRPALNLEDPISLGIYDDYPRAQYVVDYLADHDFPVENVVIVGTELRSVERVTGRLTHGKAAIAGAVSGLWMGLFVGIAFALFSTQNQIGFLITTPFLGAAFGLVWSQIGFRAATHGGARDFSSISRVVATKYEVLIEHRFVGQARRLVSAMSVGQ